MIPELHIKGSVTYPRSATDGLMNLPTYIKVTERVNKHTLFQVRHNGKGKYIRESFRSGAPMYVDITAHRGTRRWFGYVDNVVEGHDDNYLPYVDIVGVGTTYYMKQPVIQVLGSLVEAEQALIKSSGLTPIVRGPKTDRIMVPAGTSKWSALIDSATKHQQYVFTTGTTVNVLRIPDIIRLYRDEAYPVAWVKSASALNPWSIQKFSAVVSDNNVEQQLAYAIDPFTAKVTERTYGESMFPHYSKKVYRGDASPIINTDPVIATAKASGAGHVVFIAGKPLYIKGSDPGPWWIVESVTHEYVPEKAEYSMEMTLIRSKSMEGISDEPPKGMRNLQRRGDDGASLHREDNPTLEMIAPRVIGAVTWKNNARWKVAS